MPIKPYLVPFLLTLSAVVVVLYAVGAFINFDLNPGHWTSGERSAFVLLAGLVAVVLEILFHRPKPGQHEHDDTDEDNEEDN